MNKLSAAVIGVGQMGRNHLRVLSAMENVDLVAVADSEQIQLERALRGSQITGYSDYQVMLAQEKLDFAIVAVPSKHHVDVACEVLDAGLHVLVEKPLALTVEECEKIIQAAEAKQKKLMVGHIERFNPAIVELKTRILRGDLGGISQVRSTRVSPFPDRIKDVGVIMDLATHEIDLMAYLLNAPVKRLYAEIDENAHAQDETLFVGMLRFETGVIGLIEVNWLTPAKIRQISVLGEGGMYVVDYLTQDLHWYKNSQNSNTFDSLSTFRSVWEGDMVRIQIRKQEPLAMELDAFVQCIATDGPSPVSGHNGLAAIRTAQEFLKSGQSHRIYNASSNI